jgi:hypothetical protein
MFTEESDNYSPINVYSDLIGVAYAIILLAAGASILQKIVFQVEKMTEATGEDTVIIIDSLTEKITGVKVQR